MKISASKLSAVLVLLLASLPLAAAMIVPDSVVAGVQPVVVMVDGILSAPAKIVIQ